MAAGAASARCHRFVLPPGIRALPLYYGNDVLELDPDQNKARPLHAIRQGNWKLQVPHEYLTVAAEPGKGGKRSNFGKLEPKFEDCRAAVRWLRSSAGRYDLISDRGQSVPLDQSERLHAALREAGVSSSLHVLRGAGGGGRGNASRPRSGKQSRLSRAASRDPRAVIDFSATPEWIH